MTRDQMLSHLRAADEVAREAADLDFTLFQPNGGGAHQPADYRQNP